MHENISKENKARILRALQGLRTLDLLGVGGNAFDEQVRDFLSAETGYAFVSPEDFASQYPEHKKLAREYCRSVDKDVKWDFRHLSEGRSDPGRAIIVSQPNGTQEFPDILIIVDDIGIPIECKSSKQDLILWNSALPRTGGIYLFSKYKGKNAGITYFLGQDMIDPEDLADLIEQRRIHNENAEMLKAKMKARGSSWSNYPRPMYCCTSKIMGHGEREYREARVLALFGDLEKTATPTESGPSPVKRVPTPDANQLVLCFT